MPVEFNHTIVWSSDSKASAAFLAGILGLPPPRTWGPFHVVATSNGVNLDFMERQGEILSRHFAFLVSETEFDEIFERIRDQGRTYWADPARTKPGEVNRHDGGRGVYFEDPTVTYWKSSRAPTVVVAGSPNARQRRDRGTLAKKNAKATSSREDMRGITKAALGVCGTAWFLLIQRLPAPA